MRAVIALCVATILAVSGPARAELAFSSFFGGRAVDDVRDVAVGDDGSIYLVGRTTSTDFPVSEGMATARPGLAAGFVAKLGPGGAEVVWARFIGGNAYDAANAVSVDAAGAVHVVGTTSSSDFPLVDAAQGTYGGAGVFLEGDAFYARFDADDGALLHATYLGGSGDDEGHGVAHDDAGGAWIVGVTDSADLPTVAPFQNERNGDDNDALVAHIDAEGALVFASYLGGSGDDEAFAVVAAGDSAALVGQTGSLDFPRVAELALSVDGINGFVARVDGTTLVSSSYLGGSRADMARDIARDAAGNLFVVGETTSEDFPVRNAVQAELASPICNDIAGCPDGFIASLSPSADEIVWSTYLGGGHTDIIFGVDVATDGAVEVVGRTHSADFPIVQAFQLENAGGNYVEGFAARISLDGERVMAATYLGGTEYDEAMAIAADANVAWVVGGTQSDDFPTRLPLIESSAGTNDGFVAQIGWSAAGPLRLYSIQPALGGDSGWLTALIRGNGVPEDIGVRLIRDGEEDIEPVERLVDATGTLLGVRFDLRGRTRGEWSLAIASATDEVTLNDAFSIVEGGDADITCDLVGPATAAWDTETLFYVRYQNQGVNDAEYIACNLILPPDTGVTFGPPPPVAPDPYAPDQPVADQPEIIELPDSINAPTIVPNVPPHWDVFVPVRLTFPRAGAETGRAFVQTQAMGPLVSGDQIFTDIMDCLLSVNSELVNIADVVAPFSPACLQQAASYMGSNLRGNGPGIFYSGDVSYGTMAQIGLGAFGAMANCAAQRENPVGQLTSAVNVVLGAVDVWEQCGEALPWLGLILLALSIDPNDIEGPLGVGEERLVPPGQHFAYRVRFENLDEATAPAQRVEVVVPIDSALDLETFRFGDVVVQERVVPLRVDPSNPFRASGVLDMRAPQQVMLTIEATLDSETATARWAFAALDPFTGEPPLNAFLGFLPPNLVPPEGEGALFFSLRPPESGLTPGDTVSMQARIVFDDNATIDTNVWVNTVVDQVPDLRPPMNTADPAPDRALEEAPDMGHDARPDGAVDVTGDRDIDVASDASADTAVDNPGADGDAGGCGCGVSAASSRWEWLGLFVAAAAFWRRRVSRGRCR